MDNHCSKLKIVSFSTAWFLTIYLWFHFKTWLVLTINFLFSWTIKTMSYQFPCASHQIKGKLKVHYFISWIWALADRSWHQGCPYSVIILPNILAHNLWGWRLPLEDPGSETDECCLIFNPSELVTYIEWDPPCVINNLVFLWASRSGWASHSVRISGKRDLLVNNLARVTLSWMWGIHWIQEMKMIQPGSEILNSRNPKSRLAPKKGGGSLFSLLKNTKTRAVVTFVLLLSTW